MPEQYAIIKSKRTHECTQLYILPECKTKLSIQLILYKKALHKWVSSRTLYKCTPKVLVNNQSNNQQTILGWIKAVIK